MPRTLPPRELHIRLTEGQYESLRAFADASGVGLNAGVRLLVERGTSPAESRDESRLEHLAEHVRALQAVVFAGLLASEHSIKFLELITPEGRRRSAGLALEAAEDARRRLDQVEHWLQEAHKPSLA